VGDRFTTKPYIAGAAYIAKMSDYCHGCRFDPKTSCPLTPMYWAFLGRHTEVLGRVDRMKLPVMAERKRSAALRTRDARVFELVRDALRAGHEVPEDVVTRETP